MPLCSPPTTATSGDAQQEIKPLSYDTAHSVPVFLMQRIACILSRILHLTTLMLERQHTLVVIWTPRALTRGKALNIFHAFLLSVHTLRHIPLPNKKANNNDFYSYALIFLDSLSKKTIVISCRGSTWLCS